MFYVRMVPGKARGVVWLVALPRLVSGCEPISSVRADLAIEREPFLTIALHAKYVSIRTASSDHLQAGNREMPMLGRVLVNAVFLRLGLSILFQAVERCGGNDASHRNCVPHMRRHLYGIALNLPGAASLRCQSIFIRVICFLQASSERPH